MTPQTPVAAGRIYPVERNRCPLVGGTMWIRIYYRCDNGEAIPKRQGNTARGSERNTADRYKQSGLSPSAIFHDTADEWSRGELHAVLSLTHLCRYENRDSFDIFCYSR